MNGDIETQLLTRRALLGKAAGGIGAVALSALLNPGALASPDLRESHGVLKHLDFAPTAKRIIYLYMAGGPSHLETYDYKPKLGELNGQPMPESFTKGQQIAQLQGAKLSCFAPQHAFKRFGKSGQEISTIF